MRHLRLLLPAVCLALLTGCSVDRYTLKGRVMAGPVAGAQSIRASSADKLTATPVPRAMVRLIIDPDSGLHRQELGVFPCDSQGRFEARDIQAVGVELVTYRLRVEAYAPGHQSLLCETDLPSPGQTLVLRMTKTDPLATPTRAPAPAGARTSDDYLRKTLQESEPYLNGGK